MAAVLMVVIAPVVVAAPAAAVGPPAIDMTRVPAPRPAAPRSPTEQTQPCVAIPATPPPVRPARPDLQAAWARTRGSGQVVAVIDTGVNPHRLLPRLLPGGDYVSTGDGTQDCDGHGTIVAGLVGATYDPVSGFGGIAPEAAILAIRQSSMTFRTSDGAAPEGIGDVDSLAAAVRSAADQGATVINIASVACLDAATDLDDRALGAALAYAVDVRNAVVVAAAGNVGGRGTCPKQNPAPDPGRRHLPDWNRVDVVVSPSWYDDLVLTVGSVDAEGRPSRFTLGGPWVDVAAPGEGVVSLSPAGDGTVDVMPGHGGPQPISGTSYATPVVSGVVALLRSVAPQLTARQVMHRIESTTRRTGAGWDPLVGSGVVDVLAALDGIGEAPAGTARAVDSPVPAHSVPGNRFAVIGAALCAVLAVAAAVIPPLRSRRGEDIAHQEGAVDGQFGSVR
ncbi:type VII secretion-associated serine protease mycosin [Mycolicibacterium neoaurum]|uniref:type VII secretion-associated serine protease mycosin n=1 Tax=Mycolicibacterium neoaurum TaxID=1795 RepID=UPI0026722A26|nr:type VII secretion-associated serine protease mycosin [Mycolicibacterium neoaurum]MDO3401579.1 type VII secretion-associated serine protease mycosin [Mycolicibacterium neoaurum]